MTTESFVDAKEEDNEDKFYSVGDIVELRKPKGILGVIKYIGSKKNENGKVISNDIHYVIQLEEYVGNGNGAWNGYQYVEPLRPDKTMHICKHHNIRCKRSSDTILKALYNLLRSYNKLKQELTRHQQWNDDLRDDNWRLQRQIESYEYYKHKEKHHRLNESYDNIPFSAQLISSNSMNTHSSHPAAAPSDHTHLHHSANSNIAVRHHLSQNVISPFAGNDKQSSAPLSSSLPNVLTENNANNNAQHHLKANNKLPAPHTMEFGGRAPSKSSLIPHSATGMKTRTNSMENMMTDHHLHHHHHPHSNNYIPRTAFTNGAQQPYIQSSTNSNKGGVIYSSMDRDRDTGTRATSASRSTSNNQSAYSSVQRKRVHAHHRNDDDVEDEEDIHDDVVVVDDEPEDAEICTTPIQARGEKWVTLNAATHSKHHAQYPMITPPPNDIFQHELTDRVRRSHRRNQSEDYEPMRAMRYTHPHHQSSTFVTDDAGNLQMSNVAELTQNDSELTKNTMDAHEITPAPIDPNAVELEMEHQRSVGMLKQKSDESAPDAMHAPFSNSMTSLKQFYPQNQNNLNHSSSQRRENPHQPREEGMIPGMQQPHRVEDGDATVPDVPSMEAGVQQISVRQKKKDIKQGGTVTTHGSMQQQQREVERQRSMDKMKNAKVVRSRRDKFEQMIREQNSEPAALAGKSKQNLTQKLVSNDVESDREREQSSSSNKLNEVARETPRGDHRDRDHAEEAHDDADEHDGYGYHRGDEDESESHEEGLMKHILRDEDSSKLDLHIHSENANEHEVNDDDDEDNAVDVNEEQSAGDEIGNYNNDTMVIHDYDDQQELMQMDEQLL
eukprot:CAMPEP_0197076688 /NCGR_PEP_ID=MMETSP1384-20130603/212242_1 /TAXON_ID=29189 /ORGANISM="Ammonia sp." /LENGTH=837 /DNA_ID=CAMNT_0042515547 /DNA_START=12 /DNA_END=2525 /DNA_ORIENTATION=-